jgi:hypothetical protein
MAISLPEFLESLGAPLTRHYTPGPYADDVTLAKRMRAELAQAVKAGLFPVDTRHSVRINHHASLTVEIISWSGPVFTHEAIEEIMDPTVKHAAAPYRGRCYDDRLVDALNEAVRTTETIVARHNYDNSDSMTDHFDVGYYLTVSASAVIRTAEIGIRLESDPGFADLMIEARAAATALGPKVVKSVCGGKLDKCGRFSLERLVKMAKLADGRPLVYDKPSRRWRVEAA